jgi:hypothetical protein
MRRKGTHITLSEESLELLDALAAARETAEFPGTNRTALVEKAVQVWVGQVKEMYPSLRELIDGIQRKHSSAKTTPVGPRVRRKVVSLTNPRT